MTFAGAGRAASGSPAAIPASPAEPGAGVLADLPAPWQIGARIVAGLALVAVVFGAVDLLRLGRASEYLTPETAFLGWAVPWALAAALLALTWQSSLWIPGAVLGLTAGVAGSVMATGETNWYLLVGLALAVFALARPHWTSITAAVLGAAGLGVSVLESHAITGGDSSDAGLPTTVFGVAVAGLVGLAGYQLRTSWQDALAPALLLVNAAWAAMDAEFSPYRLAFLPFLVLIPAVEVLTAGTARRVARLIIVGILLLQATAYTYSESPDFTSYAHVLLVVAAGIAAYRPR